MTIVVDASVALKWVLDEPGNEAAEALLDEELVAPAFWLVEAANALWRRVARGEIAAAEAQERLGELQNAPIASLAIEPHVDAALRLATEINHPVHDCLYLAVALARRTHVVTADRRFHQAIACTSKFAGSVLLLNP